MCDILLTFEVLKFVKSKYSNLLQKENIEFISVTLFVINLLIPFISFNLLHFSNIRDILVTFDVLKFDKSKYSNSLHELNIPLIFVS